MQTVRMESAIGSLLCAFNLRHPCKTSAIKNQRDSCFGKFRCQSNDTSGCQSFAIVLGVDVVEVRVTGQRRSDVAIADQAS